MQGPDSEDIEFNTDALDTAVVEAVAAVNEHLEYELRGAWRAGYDYVHLYDEPPAVGQDDPLGEQPAIRWWVLPSNEEQPPRPDGRRYRHTYDLAAVSDETV